LWEVVQRHDSPPTDVTRLGRHDENDRLIWQTGYGAEEILEIVAPVCIVKPPLFICRIEGGFAALQQLNAIDDAAQQ
jgi:hypothetical protein